MTTPQTFRRCVSPLCRNTAAIRSRLCPGCLDLLVDRLRALPTQYTALEHGRTPGVPLPLTAIAARTAMRGVLASWAQVIVIGRGVARPARSVVGMAEFLHRHVDWLGAHPAAAEIIAEIGDLADRLRHADCAQCAGELAA